MSILVHICCAPCLLGPLDELRRSGFVGYFHNPNIHPLLEFRRRLKAVKVLAEQERFDLVCDEQYGLAKFLDGVPWRGPGRCRDCYRLRLRGAAALARERRSDAFTTTLLVSTHQGHDAVRQVGQEVAAETGVPFAYHDWRPLADNGRQAAKRRSLYCQQYCGCVFSEFDRYKDTGLHLYRSGEDRL
jgi:predicted adenine nucleotide alpha hydrolase (AANH) superfamily ATPase